MPPFLRSRLTCHYCGQRAKTRPKEGFRFKCENCLAVNFLDEQGEITDVPPEEVASPKQYAKPLVHPVPLNVDDAVFCSTCIKNQQLVTNALSNYLPSHDDPACAQYEASFPQYRQNLEDRYPPVCARCEPKAKERIIQAGYLAKSDHIRRVMDRSRARRIAHRWGWRSLIISAGGCGYVISVVVQLVWHATSAFVFDSTNTAPTSLATCVDWMVRLRRVPRGCADIPALATGIALLIGLCSIWWNPCWQHKLDGKEGRLTGLKPYYIAQVLFLTLRFAVWVWLKDVRPSNSTNIHQRLSHPVLLILETVLMLWSLVSGVKIDKTPLVSWKTSEPSLLSERQFVPPTQPGSQLYTPASSQTQYDAAPQFHVGLLGPGRTSADEVWRPPTPPEDDVNAMEWEPTSTVQIKPRPMPYKAPLQPSPFYGALPAAPTNRLLHPTVQAQPALREAIGLPPGFFDRPKHERSTAPSQSLKPDLADPTFFPQQDHSADTGLENIFNSIFSLNPEPAEVRESIVTSTGIPAQQPVWSSLTTYRLLRTSNVEPIRLLTFACCFTSLLVWSLIDFLSLHWPQVKLGINFLAALIPLLNISAILSNGVFQQRFSEVQFYTMETCALGFLGSHRWKFGYSDGGIYDMIMTGVLATLCLQELYHCLSNPPEVGAGEHHDSPLWGPGDAQYPPADQSREPVRQEDKVASQSFMAASSSMAADRRRYDRQGSPPPPLVTRPRTNSIDSSVSTVSTTTTSTASGWKTPRATRERGSLTQSPGFHLGSLALDDPGDRTRPSFNPYMQSARTARGRREGF